MMRLRDKVILVTGGASGIGRAAALCCGEEGARVAVVDMDSVGADGTVTSIETAGGSARGYVVDIRQEEQVQAIVSQIESDFGRVDSLINSAGILEGAQVDLDSFEEETWDRVVDINLKGSFLMAKHTASVMERSGGGVIVLISSGAGVRGGSSSFAYGASKGGVHGLSLVLAPRLESKNIRVHAVCPGSIDTPLKMRVVETEAKASGGSAEEMRKSLGKAEGVGKILAFLVSDEADHLRGTLFTR
jgi:NAD(P)-dependent dehydrogenase (short-subunit alcohol dehydrogenase family)